jgi:hypothetical protein
MRRPEAKEEKMQGKVDIKKALLVALTLVAIAAPAAQADPWQFEQRSTRADASDRQASESLRQFLANDDRHAGISGASDRSALSSRLRGYESFRVPQTPVSVGEPGGGVEWPTIVAGGALLALLAAFGISAIAGLRSRSRVAHS